jgi:hypothetical protein
LDDEKEFELELTDMRMFNDLFIRLGGFFLTISTIYMAFYVTENLAGVNPEYIKYIVTHAIGWAVAGVLLLLLGRLLTERKKESIRRKYVKNKAQTQTKS